MKGVSSFVHTHPHINFSTQECKANQSSLEIKNNFVFTCINTEYKYFPFVESQLQGYQINLEDSDMIH